MKSMSYVLCCLLLIIEAVIFLTPTLALAQEDSSTSASVSGAKASVRDKVRETIENLIKKPRAVIGTLNQLADSTLEIKTKGGKVAMIATTIDTTYSRFNKGKKSDIKFEELVIGDYTIALGNKNTSGVVEAKRILTYDKSPALTNKSVFGLVEEVNKGNISIKHPKNEKSWTIQTSKKTNFTGKGVEEPSTLNIKDIEAGDRIVVLGTMDEKTKDTINALRVHILNGKALGLQKSSPKPSLKPSTSPSPSPSP